MQDATDNAAADCRDAYEDLDCTRRMFGVFDAIGYSADPIALFRTVKAAEEWLAWDKSRGDDATVWCEAAILPVDDVTGRVWNSTDSAPEVANG